MRTALIVVASAAVASCNFIVPRGLADGFYTIDFPKVNARHDNYSHPIIKRHFDDDDELGDDGDVVLHQHDVRGNDDGGDYKGRVIMADEDAAPPERDNSTYRGHENPRIEVTDFQCMYDQRPLPARELDEANRGLYKFCERFLARKRSIQIALSKKGNVMSYVCNYRKKRAVVCGRREMQRIDNHYLNTHCGESVPGWAGMDSEGKKYGRAYVWDNICPYRKQKLEKTYWTGGLQ